MTKSKDLFEDLFEYVGEKYHKYQDEFNADFESADTRDEMIQAYAHYVGKLEGLLEGLTIKVK